MISLIKKTPRFTLEMKVIHMGKDLCVALSGGDAPHIGAVALAIPYPRLSDNNKIDASVSLLNVTGHKEDELARRIAYKLSCACSCTVSVSCGIHLKEASKREISAVLEASEELIEEAFIKLR